MANLNFSYNFSAQTTSVIKEWHDMTEDFSEGFAFRISIFFRLFSCLLFACSVRMKIWKMTTKKKKKQKGEIGGGFEIEENSIAEEGWKIFRNNFHFHTRKLS